jgi:hypothetical protein
MDPQTMSQMLAQSGALGSGVGASLRSQPPMLTPQQQLQIRAMQGLMHSPFLGGGGGGGAQSPVPQPPRGLQPPPGDVFAPLPGSNFTPTPGTPFMPMQAQRGQLPEPRMPAYQTAPLPQPPLGQMGMPSSGQLPGQGSQQTWPMSWSSGVI